MTNTSARAPRMLRPVAGTVLAATAALAFLTACGDNDDDSSPASNDMSPTSEMMAPDSSSMMTPSEKSMMTPSEKKMSPDGMTPTQMAPTPMSPN
ncbi:hypothetical protein [Gordonia sp. MP11Mi]|uniref:Lipoprotein n=1 Tax=Gordonia sp. MP11Mi TaxID=3022769 RepID=A0AA97CUG9_9ACTN